MQRDMTLVKRILEYAESSEIKLCINTSLIPHTAEEIAAELKADPTVFAYHISLLVSGGFLQDIIPIIALIPEYGPGSECKRFPGTLTWEGHNLLDTLRRQE